MTFLTQFLYIVDYAPVMARKVTANLYMTLDGYADFPKYPGSDFVTDEPDEAFAEMWTRRYGSVDTVVFGRRSYEGHLSVHSEKARKPSDPKFLFDYSRWLDKIEKVVLSNTMSGTDWQNSRLMKGDLKETVSQLRSEPGKDIIIDGGPSLVRDCIRLGIPDDYYILVFPVMLGHGPQYWGNMPDQQTLKLLSVKSLEYGELILHYETVR